MGFREQLLCRQYAVWDENPTLAFCTFCVFACDSSIRRKVLIAELSYNIDTSCATDSIASALEPKWLSAVSSESAAFFHLSK